MSFIGIAPITLSVVSHVLEISEVVDLDCVRSCISCNHFLPIDHSCNKFINSHYVLLFPFPPKELSTSSTRGTPEPSPGVFLFV